MRLCLRDKRGFSRRVDNDPLEHTDNHPSVHRPSDCRNRSSMVAAPSAPNDVVAKSSTASEEVMAELRASLYRTACSAR